jgi:formiminotetrahydrofolate cyclodeaminase
VDHNQTIDSFLKATAAKQPTPGGGSVTALAGALAAAMGEMVVNYSIGKKDLAAHQNDLQKALTELDRARQTMIELMIEDQSAFEAMTAARKGEAAGYQSAVRNCIQIPQAMGVTAAAVLGICQRLAGKVNKYLLSDLAVCAELSMATVRCAAYNVRVNLPELSDAAERSKIEMALARQAVDCGNTIRDVIARIWQLQGNG